MLNKILNQLDQLSKDELLTLNSAVIKMAKAKSRVESVIKGATLKVGQEVEINHPKYKGQKFIIKKVNRTKCVINDGGHTMFTCPMSMIIA
jgi:transcription elongation factor